MINLQDEYKVAKLMSQKHLIFFLEKVTFVNSFIVKSYLILGETPNNVEILNNNFGNFVFIFYQIFFKINFGSCINR